MTKDIISEVAGDKPHLTVADMTAAVNIIRERIGREKVTPQWIRLICKRQEERKALGLPFIEAFKSGAHKTAPYVAQRGDFEAVMLVIAQLDGRLGRPKKLSKKERAKRLMKKAKDITAPPIDVDAASGSVVNHLAGYVPCDACEGEGCHQCFNGWTTSLRPVYVGNQLVKKDDYVQLILMNEQYPEAAFGIVTGWTANQIAVQLMNVNHRPLVDAEILLWPHEVVYLQKGRMA